MFATSTLQEHVAALQDEPMGIVWYALILVISVPCCLPSPPFEILGGCARTLACLLLGHDSMPHPIIPDITDIFPTMAAIVAAVLGKTIGACLAFALARAVAALGWHRLGRLAPCDGSAWLARLGLERELRQRPLQTLCVIRASPVPSALKSYGLGAATNVQMAPFALACVAINTPYSIGWAFAGSSASSLQEASSADAAQGVAARVAVCVVMLLGISVLARRVRTRVKEED